MENEFRIEIPIEVKDNSSLERLQRLDSILAKIYGDYEKDKTAAQGAFNAAASGAEKAAQAIEKVEDASDDAAGAAEDLGESVDEATDEYKGLGEEAQRAGKKSREGLESAGEAADKFSQRIEKSRQNILKAFGEKIKLTIAAIDKASPALKSIGTTVKNLTGKAWRVAVKMTDFVTAPFRKLYRMITSPIAMTVSLAGLSLGASSFVSTFNDFTAGMSNVKALSGATEEQFARLTATAKELGATTKFTAAQASEGMQYLAMAGWETNDIIAAMPGLLDLAAAGGTELGTAADIVSDVMTAMGMSADEAGKAADVFAKTATSTNTTIENLGETLKYAAPIAHSFGLELSEVSAITGMMANAGVKGSNAGTAIRSSLLAMASPAADAQEAMKKLGLSFADSNGKMKDMKTIIADLSKAFSGLSEQEKLAYADSLFGKYASSGWLGVISQGADEYERLFTAIDQSEGAAKEMANTQMDNLAGDFTLLQSATDGMKISLMEKIGPYLRKGVQWLTGKIPAITEFLEGMFDKGIAKAKELKERITGVFNSSDFQNAEGFAAKFFVAWDKIIAEPFQKWWEGGGRDTILAAVGKLGKGIGDMYHGIITGIFAALKGEDIDFEGLNITGLAKAGAEAAKEFVTSFMDAFDLGGLFSEMPGLLKTALLAVGGVKAGGTVLGLAKDIGTVKLAFNGVSTAAAATAGTVGKTVGVFGGLKTALAAIPGWGWVAAAALTALTIAAVEYSKAQELERQSVLHLGDDAKAAAQQYEESAARVRQAADTVEKIHEVEIRIKNPEQENQNTITQLKADLAGASGDAKAAIEEQLNGILEDANKIKGLFDELNALEDPKLTVTAILQKYGIDDEDDVALITSLYGAIETKTGVLMETLAKFGMSYEDFLKLTGLKDEVDTRAGLFSEALTRLGLSYDDFLELTGLKNEVDTKTGLFMETLAKLGLDYDDFLQLTALKDDVATKTGYYKEALRTAGISEEQFNEITALGEKVGTDSGEFKQALQRLGLTKDQFIMITNLKNNVVDADGVLSEKLEELGISRTQFSSLVALKDAVATAEGHFSEELQALGISEDDFNHLVGLQSNVATAEGHFSEELAALGISEEDFLKLTALDKEVDSAWGILAETLIKLGVDPEEFKAACDMRQYVDSDTGRLTIITELQGYGYTMVAIEAIQNKLKTIGTLRAEVRTIMGTSSLDDNEINNYMQQLEDIQTREAEIELTFTGASLSADEVKEYEATLSDIKDRKAEIELKYSDEGLSENELEALKQEYSLLQDQEAALTIMLSGQSLTEEQLENITKEYDGLEDKRTEIDAALSTAGLGIEDLERLDALMQEISKNHVTLNFQFAAESLKTQDLQGYNEQLSELYKNLSDLTGGIITPEDLENGTYTPEDAQALAEQIAETSLITTRAMVEKAKPNVGKAMEQEAQYNVFEGIFSGEAEQMDDTATQLMRLELDRQKARALYGLYSERYSNGTMDEEAFDEFVYSTFPGIQERYKQLTGNDVTGEALLGEESPFDFWTTDFYGKWYRSQAEKYGTDADQQHNTLVDLYRSEKTLAEGEATFGTGYIGRSIEELAKGFGGLDSNGIEVFAKALAGLNEVNLGAEYIGDQEKVSIDSILQQAQQSILVAQIQDMLNSGNIDISKINEEFSKQNVENAADAATALETISGLDYASTLALFEGLGGNAQTASEQVKATQAALDKLAGEYNVTINITQNGSTDVSVPGNANGGIYDNAFLSLVAEDGPEAIIPLGSKRRDRGLALWEQAGRLLGVNEYAEGGILAPYAAVLASLPEDGWGGGDSPVSGNGGSGNTITVSVSANPTFAIESGNSPDDIVAILKAKQKELSEILGGAFADELEDIVSNMV